MKKGMRLVGFVLTISTVLVLGVFSAFPTAADEAETFRRANFSNEFGLTTPEGVNARGFATVESESSTHEVEIRVNGLTPGAEFVVINHFFEPTPARGIGTSNPADDPSCNGHFQFLGSVPEVVNNEGELEIDVEVGQIAPHIWVVNLTRFSEVTNEGTQAPSSPDAFVIGGLLLPFEDLLEAEGEFVDTDHLTNCG